MQVSHQPFSELPRSSSEYAIKVKPPISREAQGGSRHKGYGKVLSVSSPELRSMLVNLNTTVPQNLHPEELSTTHKPSQHRCRGIAHSVAQWLKCCIMSCCTVRVSLVVMQIFLGCAITSLSAYVHLFVPAIRLREKPFWAGVPLLLAGLFGIFFCVRNKKDEEGSATRFVIKTICSVLAVISVFVCVTAAVFCGIHVGQLFTYAYCKHLTNGCICYQSHDPLSRSYLYSPVEDCFEVYCYVKIFISALGGLCVCGSFAALFFVISIWKSRYGEINAATEST